MTVLLSVALLCAFAASAEEDVQEQPTDQGQVELTQKQMNKLDKVHKKVFKEKRKLISQYVEYGIISKEKGDKMIAHIQKHMDKLKKNGYQVDDYYKDCPDHHKKREMKEEEDLQQKSA